MLPEGRILKKQLDATQVSFPSLLTELTAKGFTGYAALACRGSTGLEEGILLFDSGKAMGCVYEYARIGRRVNGKPAFERLVNATASKAAFVDVVELRAEQVRNFLTEHSDTVYAPGAEELAGAHADSFSGEYEKQLGNTGGESMPADVLRKYKLADVLSGFKRAEGKPTAKYATTEEDRITAPPLNGGTK
ncbi:MAG: DUF2226 domain-containing protein [Candidatus Micrarchaeia archaeon]